MGTNQSGAEGSRIESELGNVRRRLSRSVFVYPADRVP